MEIIFLMIAMFLVGWSGSPYTAHLTMHYVTEGFSRIQAAMALSLLGTVMIGGKLLFGVASNHFGTYRTNYVILGAWILASFFTVLLNGTSTGLLYTSAVLNGIGIPIGSIGITIWCRDLSGDEDYMNLIKLSQTLFTFGSLVGSFIPGVIADFTGSYKIAYVCFTISLLIMKQKESHCSADYLPAEQWLSFAGEAISKIST